VYNFLALPIFLYGGEIWTLREKDKKRLVSMEMNFCRRREGYKLADHKMNSEILEGLKVEPADEKKRR